MVLHRPAGLVAPPLPALPLEPWAATKDTLQLYTQVVGKLRLAVSPPEPEWAHVVFYVTSRGLTTGPIPYRDRTFQVDFDFIGHQLTIASSDGGSETVPLLPRPVADFYEVVFAMLDELRIEADINPIPQEVPNPIAFDKDTIHASYDKDAVRRFWEVLTFVDAAFKEHRAPYRGRHSLVQFFWGSFDLAYTRYSGKPAMPPPGTNRMMRLSMDAEEIYAGFWPGDARYPAPAFGAYIYPKPPGLESLPIGPEKAEWNEQIGLFLLPYEAVRTAASPLDELRLFLRTTFETCASCGAWSRDLIHPTEMEPAR